MMSKGVLWIFFLLCFGVPALAQQQSFYAEASDETVSIQDPFQVRFVINDPSSLGNFKAPGFQGFTILGPPLQENGAGIVNENGRVRRTSFYTITYTLQAKKPGTYNIGAATILYNGKKLYTEPIAIRVVKGSTYAQQQHYQDPIIALMRQQQEEFEREQERIQRQIDAQYRQRAAQLDNMVSRDINRYCFVRAAVDKKNPYIGEQVIATYKLYSKLDISAQLAGLPLLNGFWSQDYNIPYPPRPVIEKLNGEPYIVFLLKKSALFPQQEGALTLDAAKVEGAVTYQGQIPIKLASAPLTIQARALPTKGQPASFTGAVGRFSISAVLDKHALSTDDAATLTVTISGAGNLKLIDQPRINFPAELGVYEPEITDTISNRGAEISGSKVFRYGMNPQTAGAFVIPAIAFSWFDVGSGTYKEAFTQPITVHVSQGKNANAGRARKPAGEINDIQKGTINFQPETIVVRQLWYWLLYVLGTGAVIALLLRRRKQEVYAGNESLFRNKKANKVAWKRLATARKLLPEQQHKAFYEEVSKAVWLYLSDKLGIPLSGLSKDTVAQELERKQVPMAQTDRVKRLVLECEMALYSPSGGQQQRQHTLDEAVSTISELETVLNNKNKELQHAG